MGNVDRKQELVKKLTSEYERWDAREKLEKMGWVPTTPKEKAYYSFASLHFEKILDEGEDGIKALAEIVSDSSESSKIRMEAAKLLGKARSNSAVAPLIKALDAKEGGVRNHAAIALGLLGDKNAVEPLIGQLMHGVDDNGFGGIRPFAARSIARIGGDQAKEALTKALDKEKVFQVQSAIKLGLVGIDVSRHLRNIKEISTEMINKYKQNCLRWQSFDSIDDLMKGLFDTFEYYIRAPVLELSSDEVRIMIDDYVAATAPATKQLEIVIVNNNRQYYRFGR